MSDKPNDPVARFHAFKVKHRDEYLAAHPEAASEPRCAECLQPVSNCAELPWCGLVYDGGDVSLDPAHLRYPDMPDGWRYWPWLMRRGARAFWRGLTGRSI
jgi:hypothetical protein